MLTRRKMLGMAAGIPLLGGLFGKRDVIDALLRHRGPGWREVGDNSEPPNGIGTYIVTNDGKWKIRLGIAQWNGEEWYVTDGDIEPDEIDYCIRIPEHPC